MGLNIYYSPECLEHKGFPGFAERPARLAGLSALFNKMKLDTITPKTAKAEWLHRAHTPSYVGTIQSISRKNIITGAIENIRNEHVQWYTRVSPHSYNAALHAAGAVCQAVEDALAGKCKRAFCAVRPPGHHAGPERGEGFCLFNNVAIGALHALANGAERVAVIDFDRHHANGTQDIVERSGMGKIFLASSYQEGCKYNHNEQEGWISETTLTVPLKSGSDYSHIGAEYRSKVIPALYDFKPDLILVSAGFDAHKDDPLTNLRMESEDYFSLTKLLTGAADDLCGGRVVSALEGGYEIKALAQCVKWHIMALNR